MNSSLNENYSSPVVSDLRIVLLGKTGSGKSATGNTILGWKAFEASISPSSVTKACKKETGHFDERKVTIVDTPGIFDTSMKEDQLKKEIDKCVMLSVPGPHIFLLVVRLDARFTEEEKNTVKWIGDNFGKEASGFTVVLFTRGDELKEMSIKDYLDKSPDLKKLINTCRDYMVFDNTCKKDRTQVVDLFEKIDKIVDLNQSHYTSSIYEEAQRKINNDKWWSKWGDRLNSAGNLIMGAAVAAPAGAVARVAMLAGVGVTKLIGRWLKPKTEDSHVKP